MSKGHAENKPILLMNRKRILRTIERMAYQIDEDQQEAQSILIAGIKIRGKALAQCLSEFLRELTNHSIHQVHLPDLGNAQGTSGSQPIHDLQKNFDYTLVVDDVIFSGQTMLHAIERVRQHVDTIKLRTAVLIDRGHRKVPVEASFSGLRLPTKLDEHVLVQLNESLPEKVILTKRSNK